MTIPATKRRADGEKSNYFALSSPVVNFPTTAERGSPFLSLFFKFVCPLVALFVLCFGNHYGSFQASIWSVEWPSFDGRSLLTRWEATHGPFVREYFYERRQNRYHLEPPEYESDPGLERLPSPPTPSNDSCSAAGSLRFDCFPRGVVSQSECVSRGCCYEPASGPIPACFYPTSYGSYAYSNIVVNERNITAQITATFKSPYPKQYASMYLLFVLSADSVGVGYSSVPITYLHHSRLEGSETDEKSYSVDISANSTGFRVLRRSNGRVLFDTKNLGGLLFADQFAQISTALPSKYLYGLEERTNQFPLNTDWRTITLFNHDNPHEVNGYGFYPSYLCMEGDGKAHYVTFRTSTAVDVRLQPGGLTFRSITGAYLEIVVTLGDTPQALYEKRPVARTSVPPFWSLGFHFSRYGYKNTSDMRNTWTRMKEAKIPVDTLWTDIDYMDNCNDFTLSSEFLDLPQFVDELHAKEEMHYVLILDPGVSGGEQAGHYPPYDRGLSMDIFVKDSGGKEPIIGKVWNLKKTVFPDFTNPKVLDYWIGLLEDLRVRLKFDGIWLDMNEPSNFVNGSIRGCPSSELEHPPYLPEVAGNMLSFKTLCMTAKHYAGSHYYVHNSYGAMESIVTSFALTQLRKERSFVISRAGNEVTATYAGIWTGDVSSEWEAMKQSVRDILTHNLLGQPLVGADICGFNGNTTKALCQRWHQLGAFYPFSRNHNSKESVNQDPVTLGIEDSTRTALNLRYTLLPYLYSLFFVNQQRGLPVIRPTFYAFPEQVDSYTVDTQFFWGDALLVVPVLEETKTYVKAYIGSGVWYNFASLTKLQGTGPQVALPAPQGEIPLLLRGGYVVPMFNNVNGALTTTKLRHEGSLSLAVALNETGQAVGLFFWDDGVSVDGRHTFGRILVANGRLDSILYVASYQDNLRLDSVRIFEVESVFNVTLNSNPCPFTHNQTTKILTVEPKISPFENFTITWF